MTREKRLKHLVHQLTLAIEDPAKGIVFDDFDERYRAREFKRELDSARTFYSGKTSIHAELEEALESRNGEPAWVSDSGQGADVIQQRTSFDLDGDEWAEDGVERTDEADVRQRRLRAAIYRVRQFAPQCLQTLKLIIKNAKNRKESIWEILQQLLTVGKNGNSLGRNTTVTSKT